MYVCVCAYMCVCIYVCVYVCVHVCMYICVCAYMCVCMCQYKDLVPQSTATKSALIITPSPSFYSITPSH